MALFSTENYKEALNWPTFSLKISISRWHFLCFGAIFWVKSVYVEVKWKRISGKELPFYCLAFNVICVNKNQKQMFGCLKDVLSCGLAGCFKVSARAGAVVYLFSPWRSAKSGGVQSSFQGASNGLLVESWSVMCFLTRARHARLPWDFWFFAFTTFTEGGLFPSKYHVPYYAHGWMSFLTFEHWWSTF